MVLTLKGATVTKWTSVVTAVRVAAPNVTTTGAFPLAMADLTLDFSENFNDGVANSPEWSVADNMYKMQGSNTNMWRSCHFSANHFSGNFTFRATALNPDGATQWHG
jgi:hypothetical protein